jgi:DNA-binding transcriptional LysR family regulator
VLHRYLLEYCQRIGYLPRIVHQINTVSELFDLVETGAGIGFVAGSIVERVYEPGLVFRESSGPRLFIDTGVAYRADNWPGALRLLVRLLREQSI